MTYCRQHVSKEKIESSLRKRERERERRGKGGCGETMTTRRSVGDKQTDRLEKTEKHILRETKRFRNRVTHKITASILKIQRASFTSFFICNNK